MSSIVHISEAASIAMHSMTLLAARENSAPVSVQEIADTVGVSKNHLSKVVQRLTKTGFIQAHRGPGGGVSLEKSPEDITLLDIFEAIEGKLEVNTCLLKERKCAPGSCILGNLLPDINKQVLGYLSTARLSGLDHVFACPQGKKRK